MAVILLVLLLGTSINVANDHPKNISQVEKSLLNQVKHPKISAADYSKLN